MYYMSGGLEICRLYLSEVRMEYCGKEPVIRTLVFVSL